MSKIIAIDGPSGAGKSSVSRLVGRRLGFLHVDSGALYRIMTWQALARGVDTSDPEAVAAFAPTVEVECRPVDGKVAYFVGGEEPGDRIRTPEINAHASEVATVKAVRDRKSNSILYYLKILILLNKAVFFYILTVPNMLNIVHNSWNLFIILFGSLYKIIYICCRRFIRVFHILGNCICIL